MGKETLVGTFSLNKTEPIHRWYSYIEGYSSDLVENELNRLNPSEITSIYDPFGGTGTTLLSASMRNIQPFYSETNPFMNEVTRIKINDVMTVVANPIYLDQIRLFLSELENKRFAKSSKVPVWDGFEKYYSDKALSDILKIKKLIKKQPAEVVRNILMLALSSICVNCSLMIRRGDLRFARGNEKREVVDVKKAFTEKLEVIISDIESYGAMVKKEVICISPDCRNIESHNVVDCVITSPPYLNGTNYIRNTKLELKLNDYVTVEGDLASLHSKGIIAGINNVSKRNSNSLVIPYSEKYVEELEKVAYDKRIPIMVSSYFADMNSVFMKLSELIKPNGFFIMDIGDSQFAGVHIPTHDILQRQCEDFGFKLYDQEILRVRHSKNGMELSQRILRFRLEK